MNVAFTASKIVNSIVAFDQEKGSFSVILTTPVMLMVASSYLS